MGYAREKCHSEFTPEQIARMRCFIDRYIDNDRLDAPRNFPPVIVMPTFAETTDRQVLVQWLPPLNLLQSPNGRASTLPTTSGLQYEVERDPPFDSQVILDGSTYAFLDANITSTPSNYKYRVTAVVNSVNGAVTSFTSASQSSAAVVVPSVLLALLVMVLALVR